MHRYSQILIFILALATVPFVALGQKKYEGPGNWFIGADAGVTLAFSENVSTDNFLHVKMPSASIVLGRTITPYWGLRLSAGFFPQVGYPHQKAVKYDPEMFSPYGFYIGSGTLDLMLNISNLCRRYDVRNWFDGYLIAGGGMLYSFGMEKKVLDWPSYSYPVQSVDAWYWNAKVGLMGAWHISRPCDLTAEIDAFLTDNAYNGVIDQSASPFDIFVGVRLGIVYYLRNSMHRHRYANPAKVHRYWSDLND